MVVPVKLNPRIFIPPTVLSLPDFGTIVPFHANGCVHFRCKAAEIESTLTTS